MKILIVGSESNYSIEKYYKIHLSKIPGVLCEIFTSQNLFLDYYRESIVNKILFRLGYKKIYKTINKLLIEKVEDFSPTVIFVFKGMEIFPETLNLIKELKILLVNYNPDNPFIFSGRGSGNKNITNSIGLYDLHFTYSHSIKDQIVAKYGIFVDILPFGFEMNDELFNSIQDVGECRKVCFLGNPDRYRAKFIKELAELGLSIDVYGHKWNRFLKHKNVSIFSGVYENEMWEVLRKYRVQLNYMRPHNLDSHNMRSFEIPAIGGIQVAPKTSDHKLYFDDGMNIFLYDNISNCYCLCKELLELDDQRAKRIRVSARNKSINSGYSYVDRAEQVFLTFKSRLGNYHSVKM